MGVFCCLLSIDRTVGSSAELNFTPSNPMFITLLGWNYVVINLQCHSFFWMMVHHTLCIIYSGSDGLISWTESIIHLIGTKTKQAPANSPYPVVKQCRRATGCASLARGNRTASSSVHMFSYKASEFFRFRFIRASWEETSINSHFLIILPQRMLVIMGIVFPTLTDLTEIPNEYTNLRCGSFGRQFHMAPMRTSRPHILFSHICMPCLCKGWRVILGMIWTEWFSPSPLGSLFIMVTKSVIRFTNN